MIKKKTVAKKINVKGREGREEKKTIKMRKIKQEEKMGAGSLRPCFAFLLFS
jgi:hypothetical protein